MMTLFLIIMDLKVVKNVKAAESEECHSQYCEPCQSPGTIIQFTDFDTNILEFRPVGQVIKVVHGGLLNYSVFNDDNNCFTYVDSETVVTGNLRTFESIEVVDECNTVGCFGYVPTTPTVSFTPTSTQTPTQTSTETLLKLLHLL